MGGLSSFRLRQRQSDCSAKNTVPASSSGLSVTASMRNGIVRRERQRGRMIFIRASGPNKIRLVIPLTLVLAEDEMLIIKSHKVTVEAVLEETDFHEAT
jgi:hypothetical protein